MRVGVLGAGYFAAYHIDAWRRLGVDLVVADRDRAKAEATGARTAGSLEEMLEAVDLLDICVPPAGHPAAIRAGISAGIPVVCQKPFCGGLETARAVTEEAEAAGVPLVVHENFRFQPWWRAVRAALDEGLIGAPFSAAFRLRTGDGRGPDAYLARQPYFRTMPRFLVHETGVHYLDVFRYLLGDPTSVWADLRRLNPAIAGEDAGIVVTEHPGGARGVLDANRLVDHASDDMRRTFGTGLVEGEGGTLAVTGDGAVHLRRLGEAAGRVLVEPRRYDGFAGDCVHALQSHVLAHLREGTALENPARDYLTVMEAGEAAYRSADAGRRVPLDPRDAGPGTR